MAAHAVITYAKFHKEIRSHSVSKPLRIIGKIFTVDRSGPLYNALVQAEIINSGLQTLDRIN